MKLLRFTTTADQAQDQRVSLTNYVDRMKEEQEKIYYLVSDSEAAARQSPHLEVFEKRNIEVLLLTDRVDEWFMSFANEFDGKSLLVVTRGEIDLDEPVDDPNDAESNDSLVERIQGVLGDRVESVRRSRRLTDSPACIVLGEGDMGAQMRRLMEANRQEIPEAKPHFEFNATHPLVTKLGEESDEDRFGALVNVLFDQATLAEGHPLTEPGDYVRRVNRLLVDLLE